MWIQVFAISALSVAIYGWFFKIKWWKMVFGIPPFIIALVLEEMALTFFSLMLIVVIIAPIIEECAKFLFTFYGKDIKTGIAVGLMFALIENALYFQTYGEIFLFIFLLREFSDPILHSTTTSISTFTWKKGIGYLGLPIAITMHTFWNFFGYITASQPYYVYAITLVYGSILIIIWYKKTQHNLHDN
jgi:RsiW-degrading membrane proteinase PrsW (M82 family)